MWLVGKSYSTLSVQLLSFRDWRPDQRTNREPETYGIVGMDLLRSLVQRPAQGIAS